MATETNAADLAARMYPDMAPASAQPAIPAASPTTTPTAQTGKSDAATAPTAPAAANAEPPQPDADAAVAELVGREQSMAERMYGEGDGGVLSDAQEYSQLTLKEPFDSLEFQARHDHNDDELAVLTEGRQVAAELLAEMRVPVGEAQQIAATLGAHSADMLAGKWDNDDGEYCVNSVARAERELRAEWGKDYEARVALAQRVAQQAIRRAPWMRDLIDGRAGNDPKLIKHFAEIGLRQARRSRKS